MIHPFAPDSTVGDIYGPAMAITDADEASSYLIRCVAHLRCLHPELSWPEALSITRQNLGYYAGYYRPAVQLRVERLYGAVHPILGSIDMRHPAPEEADDAL